MLSSSCSFALLVLLVNELMMVMIVLSQVVLVLLLLILNEQLKAGWKMAAAETILCRRSLVLGSFEVWIDTKGPRIWGSYWISRNTRIPCHTLLQPPPKLVSSHQMPRPMQFVLNCKILRWTHNIGQMHSKTHGPTCCKPFYQNYIEDTLL